MSNLEEQNANLRREVKDLKHLVDVLRRELDARQVECHRLRELLKISGIQETTFDGRDMLDWLRFLQNSEEVIKLDPEIAAYFIQRGRQPDIDFGAKLVEAKEKGQGFNSLYVHAALQREVEIMEFQAESARLAEEGEQC